MSQLNAPIRRGQTLLPSAESLYRDYVQVPPRLTEPRKIRKKLEEMTWREVKYLLDTKDFEEEPPKKGEKNTICTICHHYRKGPIRGKSRLPHVCPKDPVTGVEISCTDFATCPTAYRSHHKDVDEQPQTEAVLHKRFLQFEQLENKKRISKVKTSCHPLMAEMSESLTKMLKESNLSGESKMRAVIQHARVALLAKKEGISLEAARDLLEYRATVLQLQLAECPEELRTTFAEHTVPSPQVQNTSISIVAAEQEQEQEIVVEMPQIVLCEDDPPEVKEMVTKTLELLSNARLEAARQKKRAAEEERAKQQKRELANVRMAATAQWLNDAKEKERQELTRPLKRRATMSDAQYVNWQ